MAIRTKAPSTSPPARRRRPGIRLALLFSLALLATACGGGGGGGGGGPSDTTRPSVQIQDAPNSHDGRTAFTLGIRFSESVSGFERGDISVTGAAVTAFSGSGASYTATLRPGGGRAIDIDIAANVARDAAGNGNTAATRQTVPYVPPVAPDTTPPRVTIEAPAEHNGASFAVTFAFSEAVRGFEAGDIRITGARISAFPSQTSSARYTATLTPNTPPGTIVIEVPANVARDAAGNGNTAAARRQVDYLAPTTSEAARISGRLSFDRVPFTRTGALDYRAIRQEPIRGVWVDAVDARGAVLARTRSDADGRYRLDVAANTEVRIRISAHMQRTAAGGPRWDVKVTDNTNGNALHVAQSDLASSGTGASTRNLNAPSGWVAASGRYANTRVAGPFAILSFTYEALQAFAAVDPAMNLPALEYRWSPRNRSASGNPASGAIGTSFYDPTERLIYLLGQENEDTDEYDRSVVMHEFAHHFQSAMSRDDSVGGQWDGQSRLDMRLALSEGFGDTLDAMITNDPRYRDTFGPDQSRADVRNMETNPVNPAGDANRIGGYHSRSVAAILYDLYDGTDTADNDPLSLGLAPIYNTLTGDSFRRNRYYTSIYTFANQLLAQAPNRTATESGLDALLRRHNIFGRGDNGAGETNRGGLPATARVLPVYKSIGAGDAPITLCSVDDAGAYNRLGNRAFVEVSFTENGAHTLTMRSASGSTGTLPRFRLRPYRNAAIRTRRQLIDEPRSQTVTGNFRAGEPAVLEAYDERNIDDDDNNDGDSCFSFSVVNNP